MAKMKRQITVFSCLLPRDLERLTNLAKLLGEKPSATLRRAAIWYLDHHETVEINRRETDLEARMKKMEDRLAKLQVKSAIDIGMIYLLMYRNMDLNDRDKAVAWAYHTSVKRLRRKLTDSQNELVEVTSTGKG